MSLRIHMSNADVLEREARRLGARSGSAFEVSPACGSTATGFVIVGALLILAGLAFAGARLVTQLAGG